MSDRSEKWHATRRARELALFSGQRFEIVREVKNEEFVSPLGYKGKNGYELRNVGSGDTVYVGKATLKRMASEYQAVDLPAPKKRGRPPKKAQGGFIKGPGTKDSDLIPFYVDNGYVIAPSAAKHYGQEVLDEMNKSPYQPAKESETAEPGAHPVSEPNDEDDRSGSLAGPTFDNPNSDIVADEYEK